MLSNIGFDSIDLTSRILDELFDSLLWETFRLNRSFLEPLDNDFKSVKTIPHKTKARDYLFDFYNFSMIPRAILIIIASPILAYYSTKVLIEVFNDFELLTTGNLIFLLFVWLSSFFFLIFLIRILIIETKNFLLIRNKVLNDDLITLPNRGE